MLVLDLLPNDQIQCSRLFFEDGVFGVPSEIPKCIPLVIERDHGAVNLPL
jgi:hypothetical protein